MARHDAGGCCLPWGLWEPCSRSKCPFPLPQGLQAHGPLPGTWGRGAESHGEGAQLLF